MIAFARFEIRRTLRDSRFLLFLVAMPRPALPTAGRLH
jgi:hypothetical protein